MQGIEIADPQVRWNWGDGSLGEGPVDAHTYRFAGEYTLTMSASALGVSDRDRVKVTVIPASLELALKQYRGELLVGIYNSSDFNLEVSGFVVEDGDRQFILPQESFIGSKQTMWLDSTVVGFDIDHSTLLTLSDTHKQPIIDISVPQYFLGQQVEQAQVLQNSVVQEIVETEEESSAPSLTHSQVFIYQDNYSEVSISDEEYMNEKEVTDAQSGQLSQSAEIVNAVPEGAGFTWHLWAGIGVLVALVGLWIYERRRGSNSAYSDITLVD